ncbi:GNAT family N-acetyltransferase [Ekhidna sp.]|uniref:GNAT family N-acetyltransferase n=1 Tax=Ekhidna sp. TaxID=2608089 RepID=UPI003B50FA7F
MSKIIVQVATSDDQSYADEISELIELSAQQRGTGIARRSPAYIRQKIVEGKAIISLSGKKLVGFCYIEAWSDKQYVANSGLIVKHEFRSTGMAKKIKKKAFEHSLKLFPDAKLFGLTTSLPVMKINSELGYIPVTYGELTKDEKFWNGCKSCVNYEILSSKNKTNCICTAMLHDPGKAENNRWNFMKKSKLYERFMNLKKKRLAKKQIIS